MSGSAVPQKGRPSAERAADLERHILDMAWALFMEQGYEGVTIDAIAARGRLSKRTIYARFDTKEALLAAALETRIKAWTLTIARPVSNVDFHGWVHNFADRILRIMMTREVYAIERLALGHGDRFPRIMRIKEEGYRSAMAIAAGVLAGEIARGTVGIDDPAFAARCWFDILLGHVRSSYYLDPEGFDADAHLGQWLDRLVEVFLRMVDYKPPGSGQPDRGPARIS